MPQDLLIARHPEPDSILPFLVRIPLGERGIVLKARDTWPRTSKQARPAVAIPTARAHGQVLDIVVDTAEKYPYRFSHQ